MAEECAVAVTAKENNGLGGENLQIFRPQSRVMALGKPVIHVLWLIVLLALIGTSLLYIRHEKLRLIRNIHCM